MNASTMNPAPVNVVLLRQADHGCDDARADGANPTSADSDRAGQRRRTEGELMKREKILSPYELAVFSSLAALMVTVTLVLLDIGFRVQMPA